MKYIETENGDWLRLTSVKYFYVNRQSGVYGYYSDTMEDAKIKQFTDKETAKSWLRELIKKLEVQDE